MGHRDAGGFAGRAKRRTNRQRRQTGVAGKIRRLEQRAAVALQFHRHLPGTIADGQHERALARPGCVAVHVAARAITADRAAVVEMQKMVGIRTIRGDQAARKRKRIQYLPLIVELDIPIYRHRVHPNRRIAGDRRGCHRIVEDIGAADDLRDISVVITGTRVVRRAIVHHPIRHPAVVGQRRHPAKSNRTVIDKIPGCGHRKRRLPKRLRAGHRFAARHHVLGRECGVAQQGEREEDWFEFMIFHK